MKEGKDGPREPFGEGAALDQMIETYLGMVQGLLDKMGAPGVDMKAPVQFGTEEREIFSHLAKAQMLWFTRGFELWRQIGETMMTRGMEAVNAAPKDVSDEDARTHARMIALDKARATLREIGDLSRISAEEFQAELRDIEAALRESQNPKRYDTPRRQARPKR